MECECNEKAIAVRCGFLRKTKKMHCLFVAVHNLLEPIDLILNVHRLNARNL